MVMLNNAFASATLQDITTLVPLMYGGIIIALFFFLRSVCGVIGTLAVVALSTVTAMGLMGWLGIGLSPPVSTAPTMIMTLAIADSVHLIVTFLARLRRGDTKREALRESYRLNFLPIFLTSLTTAIGFLSMNFSDAPPFRDLGNVVAIGVVAAWLYSTTFLPALLAVLPVRARKIETKTEPTGAIFDGLVDFLARRRNLALGGSIAIISLLAATIPRIEVNDQWTEYFSENVPFRSHSDYIQENLTGFYTIEYSLPAGESGGISEPDYLHKLDRFAEWFRQHDKIVSVQSISDILKRLNKNLHGDDPDYYRIPDDRNLAAQYLLLYEFSLPYGLDLNNQINVDKSATRLIITGLDLSTRETRELIGAGHQWLADNAPEMQVEPASPTVMFAYISERNIKSMLAGSGLAIFLIAVTLVFALRSFRWGAVSLVPNLVPTITGFGVWAILVGEIGMSLSAVTGMTLGIVVDDTVHFLTKYLRGRRQKEFDPVEAIRYAFRQVGPALVITTIVLTVGFAVLSFSTFRLNAWMGQLTAIVIVLALIADFILLPAFLLLVDRVKRATAVIQQPKATSTFN
jgi:predicted RND superfamily exporter protein